MSILAYLATGASSAYSQVLEALKLHTDQWARTRRVVSAACQAYGLPEEWVEPITETVCARSYADRDALARAIHAELRRRAEAAK